MTTEPTAWKKTDKRFVAFFDILGFKELVLKNSHEEILGKLESLKWLLQVIQKTVIPTFEGSNVYENHTRPITFSDSIIIFSKEDKFNDAVKILDDSRL